jgi:gas vesicle protein
MEDRTLNDNRQIHDTGSSVAMGFLLGAVVGAGVALLLAPRTGAETREQIADAGRGLGDAVRTKLDHVGDTVKDLKQAVTARKGEQS